MESVKLSFLIDKNVLPGSYIKIYTDNSNGAIDFSQSISEKIYIYPDSTIPLHNLLVHNSVARNTGIGIRGRNNQIRNISLRNDYSDIIDYINGNYYGPVNNRIFKFAAKIFDSTDKVSNLTPNSVSVAINSSPIPPKELSVISLVGGILEFSFTPSESLATI